MKSTLKQAVRRFTFLYHWGKHAKVLQKSIKTHRRKSLLEILREDRFMTIHGLRFRDGSLPERKSRAFELLLEKQEPVLREGARIVGRQTIFSFPYYLKPEEYSHLQSTGNVTPDYAKVLRLGLAGIRAEAQARLAEGDAALAPEERAFLRAVRHSLDAGMAFSRRYAAELRRRAAAADGERGEAFEELAALMERVPAEPARSFHEAVQSVYFTNLLVWMEGHHLIGLGRFDQYLYPYLERDLERGVLSMEEAKQILIDFWRAVNQEYARRSSVLPGDTGQAIVIGGVDAAGEDVTNPLSYLVLDVVEELRPLDPKIILRVHAKTPPDLLQRCVELVGKGMGYPLFVGDELNISGMLNDGYSLEDARNYCTSACWEPLVPGLSFDQNNVGSVVFLHALEAALNHGKSIADGSPLGADFGGIEDYATYDELKEAVKKEISLLLRDKVEEINRFNFEVSPFLSAVMSGCIESGKDISDGGCKYNNFGFLSASISNTADALAALRENVYEERRVAPADVIPILAGDFAGHPELHARLRHKAPKFGNDDDRVDLIVAELADHYADELARHRNRFGGSHRPGFGSASIYMEGSRDTSASFDGRRRGEFFASNFSPSIGAERSGPTAVIRSTLKVNLERIYNGTVLDVKLTPAIFSRKESVEKIVALVKTFFQRKGQQLQVNVLDTETLRDARAHPENYPDLIVRVWGFSAYFVELPPEYQDHLISRAELAL